LVLDSGPGADDICPICGWEDDPVQLLNPDYEDGPNGMSLREAQERFASEGYVNSNLRRVSRMLRRPRSGDRRDSTWRPYDPARDKVDHQPGEYPEGTSWYYWRRNE